MIHFEIPTFGNLNSQLLHAHLLPECFTRSPRSIDACPPTDRRPPATSAIRASGVSNSYALIPPRVLSPGYNGFPPPVPLDLTVRVLFGSLRVSTPAHLFLSGVISLEYNGFPPRVPLDLTVRVLFGSSSFGSFNSCTLVPLWSDFTRIQQIFATRPSGSDSPSSLRDFGIRVIRTLQQSVLPEYILSE